MTPDLDELEKLYQAATPGPWRTDGLYHKDAQRLGMYVYSTYLGAVCSCPKDSGLFSTHTHNMECIAALFNAFPALLALARDGEKLRDENEQLRQEIEELRENNWNQLTDAQKHEAIRKASF